MFRPLTVIIAAALIAAVGSSIASANPNVGYAPGAYERGSLALFHHAPPRPPTPTHRVTFADVMRARTAGWQQVEATAPFGQNGAGTEMLLTDGSVMVQDNDESWYRLIPNKFGNYVKGSWRKAASLPSGYGPLYFASAVLADGKLVIDGGEYNDFIPAESIQGAIYDPIGDTWTSIAPPTGARRIGDASSVVLDDGTFMLGNCCTPVQWLLDESALTWTSTGTGKADANSEEGWTLLPDGKVLTADVINEPNSEFYDPRSGSWSTAGVIPVDLTQATEIGPQILRPNGTVFVAGASPHTAIYQTHRRTWVAGPDFPTVNGLQLDITDGPATLLTNGEVLLCASPGVYKKPLSMLVFDGASFTVIPGPPNAMNDSSYNMRLLMLPTGQVMATDGSDDVEIYTPAVGRDRAAAPTIAEVNSTLSQGGTYSISGTLFNGVSQTNAYGDDVQQATNYPLVRIQNAVTGHVFYARTHDHSFMGVASMQTVTTMFDVPANTETGASTIEVIANGIPSQAVQVYIN